MTRFKDFGSGSDTSETEPITFKLYGEEFTCVPEIQGKVLLDLVQQSASEDPASQAAIITQFFKNVLDDESYPRFDALLNDKKKIVKVETLADITGWLVTEYTDRPETQPGA